MNFRVVKVPAAEGKAFIKEHHYSHGIHNGPMTWGMFDGDALIGVCAFATPNSENVRSSVFGADHKDHVTELHRLAILDSAPKMSASWFIPRALKGLKDYRPNIWAVVSFADTTEGHLGTIYQATNATYYGMSTKATFYLDETGRLRHPRQNGTNITVAEARRRGWEPCKRQAKHRYYWLTPDNRAHRKQLQRMVVLSSLPYPKIPT